jgi:hypothetical protein
MRGFNDIAPYSVGMIGRDFAVFRDGQILEDGFDCRGAAVYYAHDLLDADEADAAAQADFEAERLAEAA